MFWDKKFDRKEIKKAKTFIRPEEKPRNVKAGNKKKNFRVYGKNWPWQHLYDMYINLGDFVTARKMCEQKERISFLDHELDYINSYKTLKQAQNAMSSYNKKSYYKLEIRELNENIKEWVTIEKFND